MILKVLKDPSLLQDMMLTTRIKIHQKVTAKFSKWTLAINDWEHLSEFSSEEYDQVNRIGHLNEEHLVICYQFSYSVYI